MSLDQIKAPQPSGDANNSGNQSNEACISKASISFDKIMSFGRSPELSLSQLQDVYVNSCQEVGNMKAYVADILYRAGTAHPGGPEGFLADHGGKLHPSISEIQPRQFYT